MQSDVHIHETVVLQGHAFKNWGLTSEGIEHKPPPNGVVLLRGPSGWTEHPDERLT